MTPPSPAEIAALRERLKFRLDGKATLALLDAQAAEIARLTAALEMARVALRKWYPESGCPHCSGDCGSANPPVDNCPMQMAQAALAPAPAAEVAG